MTLNRIRTTFQNLKRAGKKALIPYVTPEYPVKGSTAPVLEALADAGADLIELGLPFSDPLADGKSIQHSSQIALRNGVTVPMIFSFVSEFRKSHETPILLMGYYNSVYHMGPDQFAGRAAEAGVDGLIIPDLPPEEAEGFIPVCTRTGLSLVFLIAPTSSDDRIRRIDGLSTDFSYCVSVTGVTGARTSLGSNGSLEEFLDRVRRHTSKPFVVGFGISSAAQVEKVWRHADGAVVGSALIDRLAGAPSGSEAATEARSFFTSLRPAHG